MKFNRLILFLTVVALSMRLYFVFYGRREGYVQESVDPNKIKGNVAMTSYDDKETKNFEVVVDGKYLMLKGKNKNGVEFYVTFKNKEITNTNTTKPQGEYKFRLMKSLNGDAGYHSLAMGDSERYFMIDMTNFDAGVIDLNGVDDLSKKVKDPRAFNFKFKKM
jgi:hypothetical protein